LNLIIPDPYNKAANERVVLFASGSAGWGVGSTSNETTVAGRMEHYPEHATTRSQIHSDQPGDGELDRLSGIPSFGTVGEVFQPDLIVVMDGFTVMTLGSAARTRRASAI
jgi:hypothetical protein